MTPELQAKDTPQLDDNTTRFLALLRKYLRDFSPLNRLISGEESTDSDLAFALLQTIQDINGCPPFSSYTLQDLLERNQLKLLLDGAACEVVRSVMLVYGRNEVKFSDAGVNIAINDKAGFLMNWYQLTKSEYEQKKTKFKISANVESIMGPDNIGIHSQYLNLYDFILSRR